MKLNTGSLPIGVREYSFAEDTRTVGLDDRFLGDVAVLARIEKTARMIELKATINVKANLICDRCAGEFVRNIKTNYRMVYFFSEDETGGYPKEEVAVLPSENTVIDISDDVRQFTQLTIPLKVLCKSECKGLCQICGSDLNVNTCSCDESYIDPRWEQLNKLLNQN